VIWQSAGRSASRRARSGKLKQRYHIQFEKPQTAKSAHSALMGVMAIQPQPSYVTYVVLAGRAWAKSPTTFSAFSLAVPAMTFWTGARTEGVATLTYCAPLAKHL